VAEDGAEDAGVVTPAVAGADHGLFVDLIGDPEPGRPVDLVLHVAPKADVAHAPHPDLTCVDVEPAPVPRFVDRLRVVDVRPQPIVEGQLRCRPPGVLHIIEVPPLPLASIRARADEAPEGRHVPEK